MNSVETAAEARKDPAYLKALKELLYQLADDDFIMAFRGSEWLGLAPHIEEDVAFSSITQNTMGHAVLYYNLLEELGEGDADIIAHERLAIDRRNAVYFERQNGDGLYWEEPYYDWAQAVVRNVLYETFKKVKLEAVAFCSFKPLAYAAEKVMLEQSFHLAHWKLWLDQLQHATDEAKNRIHERVQEAWSCMGDIPLLGQEQSAMQQYGLIVSESELQNAWWTEIRSIINKPPLRTPGLEMGNGREGEHTADLDQALATFAEVYNSDKSAVW